MKRVKLIKYALLFCVFVIFYAFYLNYGAKAYAEAINITDDISLQSELDDKIYLHLMSLE